MGNLKSLHHKLQTWDESIRKGELDSVRSDVTQLALTSVPRSERLSLANICRRVQLYFLATKVLFPVIRTDGPERPNSHEIAEYCSSLTCLGSVLEAKALLANADPIECPEVLLSQGFLSMMAWNFPDAIQSFENYLGSPKISDYQQQVAKINLASSLVGSQRYEEALTLLQSVLKQAQTHNYSLVYTTGLCHLAGLHLEVRDHAAARKTIDLARRAVPPSDFQHTLLLDKIRAKLGADTGATRVSGQLFDEIKMRALQKKLYEIARDCDFAKVRWFGDHKALLAVYVGTSFPSFRSKFKNLSVTLPNEAYVARSDLGITDGSDTAEQDSLDLSAPEGLREGDMIHRLIAALNRDFYRPLTMGETYEVLFPETYFNPFTSPGRLNQIIHRARVWLKNQNYPMTIRLDDGGLVFRNSPQMPLRVPAERANLTRTLMEQVMIRAFEKFGNTRFQMEDFVNYVGCTKGQGWPYIREALEKGIVGKVGQARYTLYFFIRNPLSS